MLYADAEVTQGTCRVVTYTVRSTLGRPEYAGDQMAAAWPRR